MQRDDDDYNGFDDDNKDDRIEVIDRCACALAVHDGRIWKEMTRKNKDIFIDRVKVVIKEYKTHGSDSKYPHAGLGSKF